VMVSTGLGSNAGNGVPIFVLRDDAILDRRRDDPVGLLKAVQPLQDLFTGGCLRLQNHPLPVQGGGPIGNPLQWLLTRQRGSALLVPCFGALDVDNVCAEKHVQILDFSAFDLVHELLGRHCARLESLFSLEMSLQHKFLGLLVILQGFLAFLDFFLFGLGGLQVRRVLLVIDFSERSFPVPSSIP